MRTLHNRAHITLCPSTSVREDLRRHGFQRVRWWRRGIDTELFSPGPRTAAMRERLTGGHPHEFLLLNVGRQAPEKGLEQLREHVCHETGVRLALVGGGPGHAALKQHFAGAPVVLPGYMQGEELVEASRAADAFIFPSTTETFGLVALEAMACGLPVIAARTGGVLDTVQDGVNGLLFEPDQPAGMRPLVRRLRDDAPYRAQLGAAALAHARSRSWRATIDQLAGYYTTAIRLFHLQRRPGTMDAAG
jgi:glycosyltransferase involved in cell wall biosynthesis